MKGAPTDIKTGLPSEPGPATYGSGRAAKETLLEKIEFMSVTETQAAAELIGVIEGVLTGRINKVLGEDPEAIACVNILKAVGARSLQARKAAADYVKRYISIKPDTGS